MDRVTRYYQAFTNILMAAKAHPEIAAALHSDADASEAVSVARITAVPAAVEALRRSGFTPAQYVNLGATLIGSAFGAAMLKDNPSTKLPPGIEGENIRFAQQHSTETEALQHRAIAQFSNGAASNR